MHSIKGNQPATDNWNTTVWFQPFQSIKSQDDANRELKLPNSAASVPIILHSLAE